MSPYLPTGEGRGWSKGKAFVARQTCEVCKSDFYAPPVLLLRGGGRFCSNRCKGEYMAGHPDTFPRTKTRRGNGGARADLGGRYFRSSWEANYARYLIWLIGLGEVRSWTYESEVYEFPVARGNRFYTPDFVVITRAGAKELHEVKGWMDPRSATKLKRMAKYYPQVKIVLIDKDQYRAIAAQVGRLVPGWETVRGQVALRD